ncbi:MAG: hypothetical protein ACTHMM_10530 [Agriterribacter sp.]
MPENTQLSILPWTWFKKYTETNFIDSTFHLIRFNDCDDNLKIFSDYKVGKKDLLNLSGGIAVVTPGLVNVWIEQETTHAVQVRIDTSIYRIDTTINFKWKFIVLEYMRVFDKDNQKKNIATYILINQIQAAMKMGFRNLKLIAKGGKGSPPGEQWDGHYVWGRLGFKMDELNRMDLIELLENANRPETSFEELLSTEEGRRFWLTQGKTWHGTFYLDKRGGCMKSFKNYLKRNNISARM